MLSKSFKLFVVGFIFVARVAHASAQGFKLFENTALENVALNRNRGVDVQSIKLCDGVVNASSRFSFQLGQSCHL